MNAIRRIAVIPTLLSWTACGQIHSPKPPAQFSETVLCSYKKDGVGAFSPYWAAYIVEPEKGAADQSTYVELNGKRLGPYAQVSGMMEVGGAGKHIAFAAKKGEKWTVVVDGVEKYTHDGLLWPWSAWSPTLEGNSYIPQTRAAVLDFSPDGQFIAYPAQTTDGKYAVFVNGKPGPTYPSVGNEIGFVAGKVSYHAFTEDKKIVDVHGDQVLGPYDMSYKTKSSPDGNHYAFWAKRADKIVLVVDGKERDLPGALADYVVANSGFLAYAYQSSGKYRVRVGDTDLPDSYDAVVEMTLSPDGKKVAYWAQRDGKWVLSAGGQEFPGFSGYYYYESGARRFSVMWSPDSQHIAYYIRDDGGLVLDGQRLARFKPPGLMFQVFVDEHGRAVGSGMMSGPQVDSGAFVQAVLMRDKTKCDPFSVSLLGRELTCVEKKDGAAFMRIGENAEGPYREIRSVLLTSDQGKHYGYVIETDKGQQFVINGTISPHVYTAIYRARFNEDDGSLDHLAVKDGNLLRVVQPIPVAIAKAPATGR